MQKIEYDNNVYGKNQYLCYYIEIITRYFLIIKIYSYVK